MKDEIIKNLDKIDENRYKEISILLSDKKDTSTYFKEQIDSIMKRWNEKYSEFDIPNILVGTSIDGEENYYSNTEVLKNDTIFDIASMSKLYTEMIVLSVIDDYDINLDTKISEITKMYKNIDFLTIMDLISFNNTYRTDVDIRNCKNRKDALEALRGVYLIPEKSNYYLYTDLPIMVLTDVLEEYTGLTYKELFNKYIISKYDLKNTYLEIDNDKYLTINKNRVNDPKANIMGGFYGHCGVKCTLSDLMKFLNNVLDSKYLYLFTTISKTLDDDGSIKINKGLIGNANLSVSDDDSLASIYLPKDGFAVQGSVRCHAELSLFKVNGKLHKVVSCIVNDLYTQEDNIHKYEENHNVMLSKTFNLDDGVYKTYDIRNVLPYKGAYKEIVNLVGICRLIDLYNHINN